MGVVVKSSRYIDILINITSFIPTPLVLVLFLQQYPYFFVHFKNVFSFFTNIYVSREHTGTFSRKYAKT